MLVDTAHQHFVPIESTLGLFKTKYWALRSAHPKA
jgi:hypothetical protein